MYKKKKTLEVHHFGCKLTSTSYLVTETTTWDVLNLGLVDLKEPWIELRRSWIKRVCFTNLTETQHFFPLWTEVTIHSIFAEPMILHPKKSKIFLHHSIIVTHLKMQFILITKLKLCKLVTQCLSSLQSVNQSVAQLGPTLWDPMDCSIPGLPVHHQLPEFTQTHVHWVGYAIQPSHPLSSPSPPAFNLSQHQGLFKWVNSLHQVAKVLEFQLQHQSFQWIFRTDLL